MRLIEPLFKGDLLIKEKGRVGFTEDQSRLIESPSTKILSFYPSCLIPAHQWKRKTGHRLEQKNAAKKDKVGRPLGQVFLRPADIESKDAEKKGLRRRVHNSRPGYSGQEKEWDR